MKNRIVIILLLYFFFSSFFVSEVFAQNEKTDEIVSRFDSYRKNNLQEKLYLHTDRENYLCGEVLWFKAYYVNGVDHKPMNMSKIAYVEILDANHNVALQGKISLKEGTGEGSLFIPTNLVTGMYTVRAYTNWMKNYDPAFYFHKKIEIINTFKKLPLQVERDDSSDFELRFFPEGGNLVYGLKSKVAFKGVNLYGENIDFTAALVDDQGDSVVSFQPHKFGIGAFEFTPEKGRTYMVKAHVSDTDHEKEFLLPEIHESGYILKVQNVNNQFVVNVRSTNVTGELVHVLVHCRNELGFVESIFLNDGRAEFTVDKSSLRAGISHLTLFNQDQLPVCERLIFKEPEEKLGIAVATNKKRYTPRQQISVEVNTFASGDKSALPAGLSMSVFKLDSLNQYQVSILSYLLLSSDLKGNIAYPEFYLDSQNENISKAVDQLMLTHGWSRFKWEDIFDDSIAQKEYVPEYHGHIVSGKIYRTATSEPAERVATYLSVPGLHSQISGDISDSNGDINFSLNDFYGRNDILLKTDFTKDSIYSFSIVNPFSEAYSDFLSDGRVNVSSGLKETLESRSVGLQTRNVYLGDQVNAFVNQIKDSSAFYGEPDYRYYLDDFTRFTAMEDVMREYVPGIWVRKNKEGFYFRAVDMDRDRLFDENPIVLYDGVPIFDIDKVMQIDPLKVKRLDVVSHRYHYGDLTFEGIVSYSSYTGNIPTYQVDPRALILEYDGMLEKREFYSPSYREDTHSRIPDFRNLLFWSGSIDTGESGKTQTSFYTSDETGRYLIVVQGMSNNGLSGEGRYTFEVKNENN